jgi:hypothetical protein
MLFSTLRAHTLCALPAAAFVATLTLSAATHAAEPKKATTTPARTPLLTRDELRECMATKTRLHQQREESVQMQGQLDTEKADILREGNELKEKLAALDRTNKEQVEQYVAANNAHEKRIDDYSVRSKDFNTKVDTLTADNDAYKKNCENRRFDEKDEKAIKAGK